MSQKLVLEFLQRADIEGLDSESRINKILDIVRDNKIILLEGRLKKLEEASLIQKTMEEIDNKFKGIEIAVINPTGVENNFLNKVRSLMANIFFGDREGITLIGPATVIHEIKQNPKKLNQLSINLS